MVTLSLAAGELAELLAVSAGLVLLQPAMSAMPIATTAR
jgi:hypothetical protein